MSNTLLEELALNPEVKFLKYYYKILDCKNGYMDFREYNNPISRTKDEYKKLIDEQRKLRGLEPRDESNPNQGRKPAPLRPTQLKPIRYDSLARTRRKVIELTAQNADKFKSFVTLTFAENLTDVKIANQELNKYITQLRRYSQSNDRELYYLGVPEFQKRGAVHYHMFISEQVGTEAIPYNSEPKRLWDKANKKYNIFHSYNLKFWNKGFSQAQDLTDKTIFDEKFNLALYMCGYLYKDLDNKLFGHTKILKSNNLEKPIYRYIESTDIYQHAIKYLEDSHTDICYYETEIDQFEYLNRFKSYSAQLNQFDHEYLSTLISNTQIYQSN